LNLLQGRSSRNTLTLIQNLIVLTISPTFAFYDLFKDVALTSLKETPPLSKDPFGDCWT
jgi:hypothetical protein